MGRLSCLIFRQFWPEAPPPDSWQATQVLREKKCGWVSCFGFVWEIGLFPDYLMSMPLKRFQSSLIQPSKCTWANELGKCRAVLDVQASFWSSSPILPLSNCLQLSPPWLLGCCSQSQSVWWPSWVKSPATLPPARLLCCKAPFTAIARVQQNHMWSAQQPCLGQCGLVWARIKWDLPWAHLVCKIIQVNPAIWSTYKVVERVAMEPLVVRLLHVRIPVPGLRTTISLAIATRGAWLSRWLRTRAITKVAGTLIATATAKPKQVVLQ